MNIVKISCTAVTVALFCGCSAASPSADKNVNAHSNVSGSAVPGSTSAAEAFAPKAKPSKNGFMQNTYDRWEKEEWEPKTAPEASGVSAEQRSVSKQNDVQEETRVQEKNALQKETSSNDASGAANKNRAEEAPAVQETGDTGKTDTPLESREPDTQKQRSASEPATLQYYFDKWGDYLEAKKKQSTGPSQVEQMEAMPAIGVPSR